MFDMYFLARACIHSIDRDSVYCEWLFQTIYYMVVQECITTIITLQRQNCILRSRSYLTSQCGLAGKWKTVILKGVKMHLMRRRALGLGYMGGI